MPYQENRRGETQYVEPEHPLVTAAKGELRTFLAGAKEGTPPFVAFTDMIHLKLAEKAWDDACQSAAKVRSDAKAPPLAKVQAESVLRMSEGRMLQVDAAINHHVQFLPGYFPQLNLLRPKIHELQVAYRRIGAENIEEQMLKDMVGISQEAALRPPQAPNAPQPAQER